MIYILIALIAAYLLGSTPTAYIFGKLLKGIDIRDYGSGNVGATNVFRTVGKGPGLVVFFLDFLKGLLAVTVIPLLLKKVYPGVDGPSFVYVLILLGAAVIAGHIWTVFLRFKGGKGVATTAGVLTGLAPGIFLGGLVVWVTVFAIWRYVSLASIAAAVSMPVFAVILGKDLGLVIFCGILCVVGVHAHRANIKRLLQGSERKLR